MKQQSPSRLTFLIGVCLTVALWLGSAVTLAAPAPITDDREPTDAELKEAKLAYQQLSGEYVGDRDYRKGITLHCFHLSEGRTLETLRQLPDLRFSYQLELTMEFQDGWLKELARLKHLRNLRISFSKFSDAMLAELAELPALERLELFHCERVTDTSLKVLETCRRLQELNIGGFDVSDAGLKEVAKIKGLRRLSVSSSKITADGFRHIASIQSLRDLCLAFCAVGDADLKIIAQLKDLEALNLFNAHITDDGLIEIGKLHRLQFLYLAACSDITDKGVKEFANLKQLRSICLFKCAKVTDVAMKELGQLKDLRDVEIFGCERVTDAGLKELNTLPKRRNLDLGDTRVTDAGVKELLTKRTDLELLQLQRTEVTDAIVPALAAHTKLRLLRFYECKGITTASVKNLTSMKQLQVLLLCRLWIDVTCWLPRTPGDRCAEAFSTPEVARKLVLGLDACFPPRMRKS